MEWISVKDRLPEDDQCVLMFEKGQDCLPTIGWYEERGCIAGFYVSSSFTNIRMHVTHWMPLPQEPKEQ